MHEASLHKENCFLTLTYNNDHLPEHGNLVKRDAQLFLKRFRKKLDDQLIRYYYCGEYGDKLGRPHFHFLIFGYDFPDKVFYSLNRGKDKLYNSPMLDKLWGKGFAVIAALTFQTAAYVARYVMKKRTGKHAGKHYERIDKETGEIIFLTPEYNDMSRRPGIAHDWFKKFSDDCYPHDFLVFNGRKMKPPKYYDSMYELIAPLSFATVKADRILAVLANAHDNTPERLAVKARVVELQAKMLVRHIHSDC
jgi:hypothetical protein